MVGLVGQQGCDAPIDADAFLVLMVGQLVISSKVRSSCGTRRRPARWLQWPMQGDSAVISAGKAGMARLYRGPGGLLQPDKPGQRVLLRRAAHLRGRPQSRAERGACGLAEHPAAVVAGELRRSVTPAVWPCAMRAGPRDGTARMQQAPQLRAFHRHALRYSWLPCFTKFHGLLFHCPCPARRLHRCLPWPRNRARPARSSSSRNAGRTSKQKCATLADSLGRVSSWNSARAIRVEADVELVFPAELEARLAHRVVAHLRAGVALARSARGPRSCT